MTEEKVESQEEPAFPADESATEEAALEGSSTTEEADPDPSQPLDAEED